MEPKFSSDSAFDLKDLKFAHLLYFHFLICQIGKIK